MVCSARVPVARMLLGVVVGAALLAGCSQDKKDEKPKIAPRYPVLPARTNLPAFMKGTIFEAIDLQNKDPYPISGYGLVVNLAGTGNNAGCPMTVRNRMVDEMVRHGFGSQDANLKPLKPEKVLLDSRVAVAEVYAYLPPGARAGQRMDVFVQAVAGSQTKSLARGMLYLTELKVAGVDPLHPNGSINVYGRARGPVFVNPAYVNDPKGDARTVPTISTRMNLRNGIVMNGGIIAKDRPLWLRVRNPQLSVARAMEARIDLRFQDQTVAKTQDEAIVHLIVPKSFNGDWEHFAGMVTHLYLNGSPGYGGVKARELVQEAVKPNAALMDISYCWEGIGEESLDFIRPLFTHSSPDVAFAAARAGAFLADSAAQEALLAMAQTEKHPFQLNAVKALGALNESPRINRMLVELLSSPNALVRVEAYRVLAAQEPPPPAIMSRRVRDSFILDQVGSDGPPMIYATRSGVPRIAIFGRNLPVRQQVMFSAMENKLTISTHPDGKSVIVFDRTSDYRPEGLQVRMGSDLREMIWRLGGGSDDGFALEYSDVVGILQGLADRRFVSANFVLQDLPVMQDAIEDAPPIVEPSGRPLAEDEKVGG